MEAVSAWEGALHTDDFKQFLAQNRREAIAWAGEVMADDRAIILDTETTGLHPGAEIIEISIIAAATGATVFDSLVKPRGRIPRSATAIHGLSARHVAAAPTWPEVHDQVGQLLRAASRVVIYNAAFDLRLLRQTRDLYRLPPAGPPRRNYQCAMEYYARFLGRWDWQRASFTWEPLRGGNHRALGDCLATRTVLQQMAAAHQ